MRHDLQSGAPQGRAERTTPGSTLRRDPRKGVRIDRRSGTVHLSRVFDWFEEDFEGRGGVLPYLRGYVGPSDRDGLTQNADVLDVEYLDYDWNLNDL